MNGTWAYSPLPYNYRSGLAGEQKKGTNKAPKRPSISSDVPVPINELPSSPPGPPERPPSPSHLLTHDMSSTFLGPAIDGPPSPESIRALNKQMKRASVFDKHQSHQTSSSGSSSLRSRASGGRPSWEHGFEGITLSRKSSGRSTASSMPNRERPESVQIFGKTLFNRRGKLSRETSAQSSSSSSLYSVDTPNEAMPSSTLIPTKQSASKIFGRRRTLKSATADTTAPEKRYQISGPYNFQHVTHTHNDHAPETQRSSRMGSVAEYTEAQFADFSSEALPLPEAGEHPFLAPSPSYIPQISPRRQLHHTRSQEQLRAPPPRPPRSPVEPEYAANPPVPPPRVSSRISMRYEGFDPLASTDLDRPLTSGAFRHPRPFGLPEDAISPPISPRTVLRADDSNWPLPGSAGPTYDSFLAGVPEEDENPAVARPSRASIASNSSSLRASQSVPLLRQMSASQAPKSPGIRRPPSAASDTLGRLDLLAAQRALRAALTEGGGADEVEHESWEDDIDYCYEHEAEADCDFAWDRPSLDISRDGDTVKPVQGNGRQNPRVDVSSAMLTPGQLDMPALSPCSQASTTTSQEAITPTVAIPRTSNFSLPKREPVHSQRFLHVRKSSDASSFKESHGFTLSPSLLIPTDYREQMQVHESGNISPHTLSYQVPYEEPTLTMDKSALFVYPRTSASTTGSNETDRSQYSERHISTTSASTDFTRLTMSTTSLDIESYIPKPDAVEVMPHPVPVVEEVLPAVHARAKSHGTIMPSLAESEEMSDQPGPLRRDLSASDPNLVRLATKSPAKKKDPLLTRRRARTTSMTAPPPPGQYALFPSVHISGNRI